MGTQENRTNSQSICAWAEIRTHDIPTTKQECRSFGRDIWQYETSHVTTKQGKNRARLLVIYTLTL
jgi:hypothetical protein